MQGRALMHCGVCSQRIAFALVTLVLVSSLLLFTLDNESLLMALGKHQRGMMADDCDKGGNDITEVQNSTFQTLPTNKEYSELLLTMATLLHDMIMAKSDIAKPQPLSLCNTDLWKACVPRNCSRLLSDDIEERLWDLMAPKLRLAETEREIIRNFAKLLPVDDVLFISATSENHYMETQSMFENLHRVVFPKVQNMTFVLFDIGLREDQIKITQKACKCHVVRFPFELFPSFFKEPSCYTWKPMIVLASMMKAKRLVVYQDASIRWKEPILELLNRANRIGLQVYGNKRMHNIPVATMKGSFDFLGDLPCAYLTYTQVQSGVAVFKKNSFVLRTVLEPWAKCGFVRECFCPTDSPDDRNCRRTNSTGLHRCHRYDQSALSLIVTKLFAKERYRFHMPDMDDEVVGKYLSVRRKQNDASYFNRLIEQTGQS